MKSLKKVILYSTLFVHLQSNPLNFHVGQKILKLNLNELNFFLHIQLMEYFQVLFYQLYLTQLNLRV
jgi:hypothetical protein